MPKNSRPQQIIKGNKQNIWINTNTKPFIYNLQTDNIRPTTINYNIYGLKTAKPPIFSIYKSKSGTIWIGSAVSGLYKSRMMSNINHFAKEKGHLSDNKVKVVFEDDRGKIWIGTFSKGVNTYTPEDDKFNHLKNINPVNRDNKRIYSIFQDDQGFIWIGGNSFLTKINRDEKIIDHLIVPDSIKINEQCFIKSVSKIKNNVYLLGTLGNGLIYFNSKSGQFKRPGGNYQEHLNNIKEMTNSGSLAKDGKGNVWIGLYNRGVIKYNIEKDSIVKELDTEWTKVNNIFYENSEKIWICSRKGLFLYNENTDNCEIFSIKDGLISNNVLDIVKVDSTIYWVSTNYGMAKFDFHNKTFTSYSKEHNLKYFLYESDIEYIADLKNIEENTLVYSQDNYIYIGGRNGIDKFAPETISPNYTPPNTYITGMSIVGKDTSFSKIFPEIDELKLSHQDYKFQFKYNIFSYHIPDRNQLAYKLEDYNKKWIKTRAGSFSFSNVPAGDYTLKLRGRDAFGNWSDGQKIKLTIVPPFWETPEFFVSIAILGILLVFGVIKLRTRTIQNQKKVLDRKVKIRTRELNQKKDELQVAHDKLEDRVKDRTRKLLDSNQRLREEVIERKRVQKELHKSRQELERNLRLQEVLSEISFLFNTMEDLDKKISKALNKLNEYIDADGLNIYEKMKDDDKLKRAFNKNNRNSVSDESKIISSEIYEFYKNYFKTNDLVRVEDIAKTEDIPDFFVRLLNRLGVKSFFSVPICIEDNFFGLISIYNYSKPYSWKPSEITLLNTVANLLSNAYQKDRIEKSLIKSEKTSKSLVNAPKEPSVLLNSKGEIIMINESFAELVKENKDNLIGKDLINYFSQDLIGQTKDKFSKCIQNQKPVDFEVEIKDKFYSVSIYPIPNLKDETSTAAIFARDITTQKEAEEILKHNQEELEKLVDQRTDELHQANVKLKKEIEYRKIAEKDLVASEKKKRDDLRKLTLQLAHEIKNPLASIKSSAQLLKYMYNKEHAENKSDKMLQKMEVIAGNVDTCNKVVQELYNYTHRGGMQLEENNLSVILKEIQNYAFNKADNFKNIEIDTDFEVKEANLSMDMFKILQALKNVINNAFDAIQEEGIIFLQTQKKNNSIRINIEDDGNGIKKDDMENIFDPFYTTKVKGFGIGLSVVKEIIESHDGKLMIDSEYGRGTVTTVELPINNK